MCTCTAPGTSGMRVIPMPREDNLRIVARALVETLPRALGFQVGGRFAQAARWLLDMIAPYTRSKTNQVALAIQILERHIGSREDLLEVAHLADTLSKFNVRSNHRRRNHAAMVQGIVLP